MVRIDGLIHLLNGQSFVTIINNFASKKARLIQCVQVSFFLFKPLILTKSLSMDIMHVIDDDECPRID